MNGERMVEVKGGGDLPESSQGLFTKVPTNLLSPSSFANAN